ncbi:MAG: twin-arginine translocase subunit TatC [Alphaproteobacteria bacterium]|nr:twin-arginine translocase subunit TatC [Alphaproteobacteria bacterium]
MTDEINPTTSPLLAHAIEFRHRLVISLMAILVGFVVSYLFAENIYAFLVRPLAKATQGTDHRMIYTGLTEAFITYIRLALWGGCILALPVIASQIWAFIAPGLYHDEKRAFLPFLVATPLLFCLGAAMAYYLVFPMAWKFFLSFEVSGGAGMLPIQMEARVSEYLSLATTIIFAFGISFELPVFLILLARAGLVTSAKLSQFRRYAIVLIFAMAAILTPPDVFSQVALALPLIVLYEISIFGARWAEKQRSKKSMEPEAKLR